MLPEELEEPLDSVHRLFMIFEEKILEKVEKKARKIDNLEILEEIKHNQLNIRKKIRKFQLPLVDQKSFKSMFICM